MLRLCRRPLLRQLSTQTTNESVYIAFGSNLGDRAASIYSALNLLSKHARITNTSQLYESAAMYNTNQPPFLNGVVQLQTTDDPHTLLHTLKSIEASLGRDLSAVPNSPRPIDLDIIAYGSRTLSIPHATLPLTIPHPRAFEREFVIRPLCDIDPTLHLSVPSKPSVSAESLLSSLPNPTLSPVTPLPNGTLLRWGHRTLLMGVLNITPDSFSDGGNLIATTDALRAAERFVRAGFDVLDIGGQSTRPGAQQVPPDVELARVTPVLEALRQNFPHIALSIDTFSSSVAASAVKAGAHIINDVSAGRFDADMHAVVARSHAAYVAMHSRGTSSTMATLTDYDSQDVTLGAAHELCSEIERCMNVGVRRWSIIADCGIGFAKTVDQNKQLMAEMKKFKQAVDGLPVLLGASRKSWMRDIVQWDDMAARDWATAGAIAAAVGRGGVDMVRVHEPAVADAIRACDAVCHSARDDDVTCNTTDARVRGV